MAFKLPYACPTHEWVRWGGRYRHSPAKQPIHGSGRLERRLSQIPEHVAERELRTLAGQLAVLPISVETHSVDSLGPGNVAMVKLRCENVTETFTAFGQRGVKAETVAHHLVGEVRKYLSSEVPVGEHLADQLLIPLALASEGAFMNGEPSPHTTTNLDVIGLFLPKRLGLVRQSGRVRIFVKG